MRGELKRARDLHLGDGAEVPGRPLYSGAGTFLHWLLRPSEVARDADVSCKLQSVK